MKRILSLIVAMLIVSGMFSYAAAESTDDSLAIKKGDVVQFGHYERDNKQENGAEPIEWLVLEVNGNYVLLITKDVIDSIPFDIEKKSSSWEQSELRKWLNSTFFQEAFTMEEQSIIQESNIDNANESSTVDHVYLLSSLEALKYLPEAIERKALDTDYARGKGNIFSSAYNLVVWDAEWWLRTPGKTENDVQFIDSNGNFGATNAGWSYGVRPVIKVYASREANVAPFVRYPKAALLEAKGQFDEAANMHDLIGNYYDSPARAIEDWYKFAGICVEKGDYDTAIMIYDELDDYKDSLELCRKTRYDKAVAAQEAGDYRAAVQLFGEAGLYQDSTERLKKCLDQLHIPYRYFTETAYYAGHDNGYKGENKPIDSNDKHYGWRLGRFFIYNYTNVIETDKTQPVFIKTLGDSVTIWFDLEQDIDALHGNQYWKIAEDTNGHDVHFGLQETNFGRGALIIRQTDYRNDQHIEPYFNYLQAEGTTAANTKVVLNEEGDYELALDYEMQDNDVLHLTNKWADYKIFIKFSIRNGNCMVYPFDVQTKAELQNTSITENGFYLDLARSRYLDINVKRTVIVKGPTGTVEDVRFNRPATDGDEYTEKGIYTISVKNRYTGESTTKTLFVGSDELLQEYIANGFSMDRLK